MRGNSHVRFGGRAEETDRLKGPHRASARPIHSYATAALAANVSPKVISERLGHAKVGITLDVYSHVLPSMDEQAALTVARLILGDDGAPTA